MISRRGLFLAATGACVAPSRGTRAQHRPKLPTVGVLSLASRDSHLSDLRSFREGLRELDYIEGRNIFVEEVYADGDVRRLPGLLDELLRRGAAVLVTPGPSAARAIRRLAPRTPVVAVALPSSGKFPDLFEHLAHPGGSITGFSHIGPDLAAKRVEILRETLPDLAMVGVLYAGTDPLYVEYGAEAESAVRAQGLQAIALRMTSPSSSELLSLVGSTRAAGAGAVLVIRDYITETLRSEIFRATTEAHIAGLGEQPNFAEAGALVSYGASIPDLFRRAAEYVDKILKGASPAELPIQLPIKFTLVLNLKTAGELGVSMPSSLLVRADQVIE
jgi:putative tryptophan/tyrosine transport system substrate-binding protein